MFKELISGRQIPAAGMFQDTQQLEDKDLQRSSDYDYKDPEIILFIKMYP